MNDERRSNPERREALEALAKVGRVFAGSLDPEAVGEQIAHTARELLRASSAIIYGLRPETEELVALALSGEAATTFDRDLTFPKGSGVAGLAVRERQPVVTPDLLADPRIELGAEVRARVARMQAKTVLALPLAVQDRVIGALSIGDRIGRVFEADQIQLAQLLADQAAVALEHARLYQEARDARDFLQSIAENSADAIVTTDTHGRFTYFSRGAEEIFGYRADEILGRCVAEFSRGGLEEARGVMTRLEAEGRIRNYESGFLAKDGRWVDVSSSISLLRDATDAVVGTIGIMKDISERRGLEAQLRQSQKMEAVGRLAGGIAHDFNNLLTVILGRSALLLERLRPDDPVRRDVDLIGATAERAAALVRQLLAFSRRQMLQPVVLDLHAVVDGIGKMLQRLIGEHIELVTVRGAALGRVKADPAQLEQVIVNLVVNARDAMPHGGRLTIETGNAELDEAFAHRHVGARPGRYVMLAVSDTGVGMEPETLVHIFEPFFTTKEPGQGTGLGLATVYGIVKQSGGYIWAESAAGRGSTFRIYLLQTEESARAGPTPMPAGPLRGTETVLVVEDDGAIRSLARDVLQMHGYGVLEARHGADAVWICDSYEAPIHLLITDVVMPHMSGRELADRLSAIRPDMRVLYVTGYTEEAIGHRQALDPGVALLHKPFPPTALVRKVRELLDVPRTTPEPD